MLASWWFCNVVHRPTSARRGTRPTWPSPAWLIVLRVLVLRDSVWAKKRAGFLDEGEPMRGGTSARDLGPFLCQCIQPSCDVDAKSWKASLGVCAVCQHLESPTRGRCPGAASGARARRASLNLWLDGCSGHRIVDLLQGGKEVSVLCAVCGSHGGRVVRRSLLSKCPGAPTPGRRQALHDLLLSFLSGSKRTE